MHLPRVIFRDGIFAVIDYESGLILRTFPSNHRARRFLAHLRPSCYKS